MGSGSQEPQRPHKASSEVRARCPFLRPEPGKSPRAQPEGRMKQPRAGVADLDLEART